jgi:hypothetical protein
MKTIPSKVVEALLHIQGFFPSVCQVYFGAEGRWLFVDENLDAPDFSLIAGKVNLNLLQEAADAAYNDKGYPCGYSIPKVKPMTLSPDAVVRLQRITCEVAGYLAVHEVPDDLLKVLTDFQQATTCFLVSDKPAFYSGPANQPTAEQLREVMKLFPDEGPPKKVKVMVFEGGEMPSDKNVKYLDSWSLQGIVDYLQSELGWTDQDLNEVGVNVPHDAEPGDTRYYTKKSSIGFSGNLAVMEADSDGGTLCFVLQSGAPDNMSASDIKDKIADMMRRAGGSISLSYKKDRDLLRELANELVVPAPKRQLHVTFRTLGKGFQDSISYGPYDHVFIEDCYLVGFNAANPEGVALATQPLNAGGGWVLSDETFSNGKVWTQVYITDGPMNGKELQE